MPVGRVVLKSISDSYKLSKLKTDGARLLYTWLLTHLDINGCFSGDPRVLKGKVFTRLNKTQKTVGEYLEDLETNHLIIRYEINGDIFLNVPDFVEKQPSLNPKKEAKPTIPLPPPDLLRSKSRVTPRKVKESKVKESKVNNNTYAEFVLMTTEEHKKLIEIYGEANTQKFIEKLNNTKGANRKLKYDSDYFAILKWVVDAVIGEDKKKELKKAYQLGIQKEKEWKKNKEKKPEGKGIPEEAKKIFYKTMIKTGSPKSEEYRKKLKELEGEGDATKKI